MFKILVMFQYRYSLKDDKLGCGIKVIEGPLEKEDFIVTTIDLSDAPFLVGEFEELVSDIIQITYQHLDQDIPQVTILIFKPHVCFYV